MSEEQKTGIRSKATVRFTLHVHLDDGTTKDIHCVGQVMPEPQQQAGEACTDQEKLK